MSFSLFPKSVKFYELFKRQNKIILEAANALNDIFQESCDMESKCKNINIIEVDGDKLTRKISKELYLTFITPIDREDIHEINLAQEDILNLIKAISTRMCIYAPGLIRFPAKQLVKNIVAMLNQSSLMLEKLPKREAVEDNVKQVKSLKNECEMLLLVGLAETYDIEQTNSPTVLTIMKWTHIYDRIEQAVERVEDLSDIIEGTILKNA